METTRRSVVATEDPEGPGEAAAAGPDAPAGASRIPHSAQNFAPGSIGAAQVGQVAERRAPHSEQNFAAGPLGEPQAVQFTASLTPSTFKAAVGGGA